MNQSNSGAADRSYSSNSTTSPALQPQPQQDRVGQRHRRRHGASCDAVDNLDPSTAATAGRPGDDLRESLREHCRVGVVRGGFDKHLQRPRLQLVEHLDQSTDSRFLVRWTSVGQCDDEWRKHQQLLFLHGHRRSCEPGGLRGGGGGLSGRRQAEEGRLGRRRFRGIGGSAWRRWIKPTGFPGRSGQVPIGTCPKQRRGAGGEGVVRREGSRRIFDRANVRMPSLPRGDPQSRGPFPL